MNSGEKSASLSSRANSFSFAARFRSTFNFRVSLSFIDFAITDASRGDSGTSLLDSLPEDENSCPIFPITLVLPRGE